MRFSTLLLPLVALVTGVVADGTSIQTAMETIQDATTALNTSITSFRSNGDPLTLLPIILKSTTLLSDVNKGVKTAEASANLNTTEAFDVAGSTLTLVSAVQTTLANIVAGKELFSLELVSPVIYANLIELKSATDKFSAAVISKVPGTLVPTAQQVVAPIDPAFEAAIDAYKGAL